MARGREEHQARIDELNFFGKALVKRCKSNCELCATNASLVIFEVPPVDEPEFEKCVMICETCQEQIEKPDLIDVNHWYCLNESAWSQVPAVQVLAWRQLQQLKEHGWASDLLEMLYLDDEVQAWAQSQGGSGPGVKTFDSNGVELLEGDAVHIIKDLNVKGTTFTAKRGTLVKSIRLTDNPEHVEGRVNKTTIVLRTEFLKKVN